MSLPQETYHRERANMFRICKFKNASYLGKMFPLSKIHKRLYFVLGHTLFSYCGTITVRVSECLDNHLQNVMKQVQ